MINTLHRRSTGWFPALIRSKDTRQLKRVGKWQIHFFLQKIGINFFWVKPKAEQRSDIKVGQGQFWEKKTSPWSTKEVKKNDVWKSRIG